MPKILPDTLRPYDFHGVHFDGYRDGDKEVSAACPFCGREGKFHVSVETGQFQCFVCREGNEKGGGNSTIFVRRLYEISYAATKTKDYQDLCNRRRYLYPETLLEWGLARSILTGNWLVPGYNDSGQLVTLYSYGDKLYPTPTLGHALMRAATLDSRVGTLYVCEGPWDAIALYEVLRRSKASPDGKLLPTANQSASILADAAVVAVPGCGSVGEPMKRWVSLCSGRHVVLMFDNDHPREVNGRKVEGGASAAVRRAGGIIERISPPARSISCLYWGEGGWSPKYPSGYDVRDILTRGLNATATNDA